MKNIVQYCILAYRELFFIKKNQKIYIGQKIFLQNIDKLERR